VKKKFLAGVFAGSLMAASMGGGVALAGDFAGDGDNFGQCAKAAAHSLSDKSHGEQGDWMNDAQENNPHDRDLQCDQTGWPVF
jgi:hypothetical protein